MGWSSPDSLLAEIPLAGSETILTSVRRARPGAYHAGPGVPAVFARIPAAQSRGKAPAALERLAKATGGCERLNLGEVWRDIPRTPRRVALAPYLLLAAVVAVSAGGLGAAHGASIPTREA